MDNEYKGTLLDDPTWQPTCALCKEQKDRAEFMFYPAYNEFVCDQCEKSEKPYRIILKLRKITRYKPITDKEIEELKAIDKRNKGNSND